MVVAVLVDVVVAVAVVVVLVVVGGGGWCCCCCCCAVAVVVVVGAALLSRPASWHFLVTRMRVELEYLGLYSRQIPAVGVFSLRLCHAGMF